MQKLFKRGDVWWCRVPNPNGGRALRVSTGCRDRKAAEAAARDLERQAVDPSYRAAHETTVAVACDWLLTDLPNRGLAAGTIEMYTTKSRHLVRVLGTAEGNTPRILATVDLALVADHYVPTRKAEGASQHTIAKELYTLLTVLTLAKQRKAFVGDPREVLPRGWSAGYEPRKNFLPESKAVEFLESVEKHYGKGRAALVAFILATGARFGEATRAQRGDINLVTGDILVRGSKTEKSWRRVPITSIAAPLLERVSRGVDGASPLMFKPWAKEEMWRGLKFTSKRVGVDRVSANDLRRTHATWLLLRGVDVYLISKVLGHVDSQMVERVYGQLDSKGVGRLIERRLAEHTASLPRVVGPAKRLTHPKRPTARRSAPKARRPRAMKASQIAAENGGVS